MDFLFGSYRQLAGTATGLPVAAVHSVGPQDGKTSQPAPARAPATAFAKAFVRESESRAVPIAHTTTIAAVLPDHGGETDQGGETDSDDDAASAGGKAPVLTDADAAEPAPAASNSDKTLSTVDSPSSAPAKGVAAPPPPPPPPPPVATTQPPPPALAPAAPVAEKTKAPTETPAPAPPAKKAKTATSDAAAKTHDAGEAPAPMRAGKRPRKIGARTVKSFPAAPPPMVSALKKDLKELQDSWLEIIGDATTNGDDLSLLPSAEVVRSVKLAPSFKVAAFDVYDAFKRNLTASLETYGCENDLARVQIWQARRIISDEIAAGHIAVYNPVAEAMRRKNFQAPDTAAILLQRVPWTTSEFIKNLRDVAQLVDKKGSPIAASPLFTVLQPGVVMKPDNAMRAALVDAAVTYFAAHYGVKESPAYIPRFAKLERQVMAARGPALTDTARDVLAASTLTELVDRWLVAASIPSRNPTTHGNEEVKQSLMREWANHADDPRRQTHHRYVSAWAMLHMPITDFSAPQFAQYQVPYILLSALQLLKANAATVNAFHFGAESAVVKAPPKGPNAGPTAPKEEDLPLPTQLAAFLGSTDDLVNAPVDYTLKTRNRALCSVAHLREFRAFLLSPRGSGYLAHFLTLPDVHLRVNVCRKPQVWLYLLRQAFLNPLNTDIMTAGYFANSEVAVFAATELWINLGFVAGVRRPKTGAPKRAAAATEDAVDEEGDEEGGEGEDEKGDEGDEGEDDAGDEEADEDGDEGEDDGDA